MYIWRKFRMLFRKDQLDADMAEEMRLHVELQAELNHKAGMDADEARFAAIRQFGNVASIQEQAREQRGWVWPEQLAQDLRYAARSLRRNPGFTTTVVVTLALAIGANASIFSFFRGILLRPLPYAEPERVVLLKKGARDYSDIVGVEVGLYAADFADLRQEIKTVEHLAAFTAEGVTLTGRGDPTFVYGAVVSREFFTALGSRAALGRVFTEADAAGTAGRPLVLGHAYWQNNLGGDPAIIGQTLTLNGVAFTVTGVMPADFEFPHGVHFWASPSGPLGPDHQIGGPPFDNGGRGHPVRTVLGRLRPGISLEQAEQEVAGLVLRLPNPNGAVRELHLVNMQDQTLGNVRPALAVLLGCVGLVLLMACLNVANLLLSRATTRQREMGIRLALGSGRGRIIRQLLTESLLLAGSGGLLGVGLSHWGLAALVRLAPADIPRLSEVRIDGWVVGFAVGISVLTGLICGLAPVFETTRADLASTMKLGGRAGTAGGISRWLRSLLVTSEVAVSLVLLVAAGLLLRSFWQMRESSWGFEPAQVVSARVIFMDERYGSKAVRLAVQRSVIEKLRAIPGFESSATSFDRIGESWIHLPFTPAGYSYPRADDAPQANFHLLISPDYFKTLRIPLQQGRDFDATDTENSPPVVVVDAALARHYYPEGQAVGKRIKLALLGQPVDAEIIGVVGEVKADGPDASRKPDIYIPYTQLPWNGFFIHVRTPLGVAAAGAAIKRVVAEIDRGVPLTELASMEDVVARPAAARQFSLGLLGVFAGIALVLAAIGIYGVTAYGVAQRTREIGVRMALGARPESVVGLVLGQSFRPVAIGLVSGLIGGMGVAYAMRKMLFGIAPLDAPTFVAIPLLFTAIALVACLLPARRAAKVDPIIALRAE